MKASFKCPKCGNEFEVSVNVESKKTKAADRIEQLKKAGVDTTNLFAIQSPNGEEFLGRFSNGSVSIVGDNDPIFKYIKENGAINNSHLFRRWVMAQTFKILSTSEKQNTNPTEIIRSMGYEYQIRMLKDELYAQYKMYANGDIQNYLDRNRWFNKTLVLGVLNDYVSHIHRFASFRGKEYIDETFRIMSDIKNYKGDNPKLLFVLYLKFYKHRLKSNFAQHKDWINAFKGAGAFYTLQNLFRFHNCNLYLSDGNVVSGEAAVRCLEEYAEQNKECGWKLYGLLKETLLKNHIDIESKMRSWRK